ANANDQNREPDKQNCEHGEEDRPDGVLPSKFRRKQTINREDDHAEDEFRTTTSGERKTKDRQPPSPNGQESDGDQQKEKTEQKFFSIGSVQKELSREREADRRQ